MPKSIYLHKCRAKKAAENDFFKLMNHSVFTKTMENVQKHRDIKFVQFKGEETTWCQVQIITAQTFSQKICWL